MPELNLKKFTSVFTKHNFSVKDIKKYEEFCLKSLNYELVTNTAYDILHIFFNCGIFLKCEMDALLKEENDSMVFSTHAFHTSAKNLLNRFINSNKSLLFNPVQIALSVIYLTRKEYELDSKISEKFILFFGYDFDYIEDCSKSMKLAPRILNSPSRSQSAKYVINFKLENKENSTKDYKYEEVDEYSLCSTNFNSCNDSIDSSERPFTFSKFKINELDCQLRKPTMAKSSKALVTMKNGSTRKSYHIK